MSSSSASLVRPDALTFTVITSAGAPLAKRFRVTDSGDLSTETAATLVRGEARVEHASGLTVFAERLDSLATHQAVVYGIPSLSTAAVVTQKQFESLRESERTGVITRTREHLQFAPAPGIAMLDFDPSGATEAMGGAVACPDQVRELLVRVVFELATAPMMWRPSSSSYLSRDARGARPSRSAGVHRRRKSLGHPIT